MKRSILGIVQCFIFSISMFSQVDIQRIEPLNWWVGMKNPKVQLLVYGKNIASLQPTIAYKGIKLETTIRTENPNYLFLDLLIAPNTSPGTLQIQFRQDGKDVLSREWKLLPRDKKGEEYLGFDNADVMYLITPDRFANGDPSIDDVAGLEEKVNRTNKGGRHGGDIEGIRKNLDYLKDMGFTAIWLNPVLENDMKAYSYHGYSTTDFYKVDPRFGSNASYRAFSNEAAEKGIKLIMDIIVNHCGSEHWWMKDPPMHDWINTWEKMTFTNHLKTTIQDPYVAKTDKKQFADGWFVETMPDLNQRNPFMATYLTQMSIWWIEYANLAGIRMDTYPYPDMEYMADWTRAIMEEYPNFNIVGEEWNEDPAIVAYWQKGKQNPNGYTSELKSLMDFPLQMAMARALIEEEDWGKGWINLYTALAKDFLYANPMNLVVFPDNHDMPRIFAQLEEDVDLMKLALTFVLTTRGIPQLFYGTEILMNSPVQRDDGLIRSDFPGGWPGDKINGFTGKGLQQEQKDFQAFCKKLLTWRRSARTIHFGKLTHFAPQNGVYVYFRYDDANRYMIILNKNEESYNLPMHRFEEMLKGVKGGTDVLTGTRHQLQEKITLSPRSAMILELGNR